MMGGWGYGMGAGGWVLMSVVWLLLIAVVVWAVIRLFPRSEDRAPEPPPERPEEILERRLARGEIDPETYDTLRDKLEERTPAGGRRGR
jgi:putative membrane protein